MISPCNSLYRPTVSIESGGHGFEGVETLQKKSGLRVVEGMPFGLDLWSFMESAAE